ncbi:MAG: YqgE/AlgH family protein [Sphingobium sp.]|nr:YqgE/AlgH family protein [Sphingobium sp.]
MDSPLYYAGRMLLALPGMGDENFDRAAIAMCVHDEHGALGLDIAHAIPGLTLADVMDGLSIEGGEGLLHVPVLRGGPVEPQRGFLIHSRDWGGQDAMVVNAHWALSGSLDILKAIAQGGGPRDYIVTLGYTGWGEGQLEDEMTRHGWFLGEDIAPGLVGVDASRRWEKSFAASGVDVRLLAGQSGLA